MIDGYASRHDPASVRDWHESGAWGEECVHDMLDRLGRDRPADTALTDGRWRLTFAELAAATGHARAVLAERGVGRGTVVAVDFTTAVFNPLHAAASSLGAITLSVPPGIDDAQLTRMLGDGAVDHLLTEAERAERLARNPAPFSVHSVHPEPAGQAFVPLLTQHRPGDGVDTRVPRPGTVTADDLYHLVPTSGTTGFPRLALRTHNSWLAMARKKMAYLRTGVPLSEEDRMLVMTPISYGLGYFHGYVIPAYLGGARTCLMRRFDAADALRLIEQEGITIIAGVPAQLIRMLDLVRERGTGTPGAKLFLVGGDHLDRSAAMEYEELTGTFVVALYGLVDAGLVTATAMSGSQRERFASAGLPLRWTGLKLVPGPGDQPGEGEIAVQTPDGIAGYYPVDTPAALTPDGYALSGDLGRIDADGNLHIIGRRKDLIIRGGLNINVSEVEDFVLSIPRVRMVAVVGVPHPVLGEQVCAVVEPTTGEPLTLRDVQEAASAAGFPKKYWPEHVVLVDALPTTNNGKVDKKLIRTLAARAVGATAVEAAR